jgi:trans-2,3-dihydro-3-hydroxyanthranilate isomerase
MRSGGDVSGAWMTAPQPLTIGSQVSPEAFAAAINLEASDIDTSLHPPEVMTVGLPFIVAKLHSRAALKRATPNLAEMSNLLPLDGADGVYVYTQDVDASDGSCDFSARMFAPFSGVIEDAATGSATAAIAARLAMTSGGDGVWQQTFAQGIDLGRPSRLAARVTRRDGELDVIQVGGDCVQVMQGTLDVTPD